MLLLNMAILDIFTTLVCVAQPRKMISFVDSSFDSQPYLYPSDFQDSKVPNDNINGELSSSGYFSYGNRFDLNDSGTCFLGYHFPLPDH